MNIGFIGLGIMGRPMVKNLLKGGEKIIVFDQNPAALEEAVQFGAIKCESIEEVAKNCQVFMTMLPDGPDVRNVVIDHALPYLHAGSVVIDMSSIDPVVSREIYEDLQAVNIEMLDAPVSGGEPKAIDGTLAFMVGGKQEVFDAWKHLLNLMGTSVIRCGDIGAGNVAKLCNQIIVALNIAALSEALVLGSLAGVHPEAVFRAVRGGLAGSTVMESKAPMMISQKFDPGFRLDLHIKDLKNAIETSRKISAPLPLTVQVMEMMKILHRDGWGSYDHSTLIKYYEKMIGETM